MAMSNKKSASKVEVTPAVVQPPKSAKKGKREAEHELEKLVSAKKQKRDEVAEKQMKGAKVQKNENLSSSVDSSSSDSEDEKKTAAKASVPLKKQLAKNGTISTPAKKSKPASSCSSSGSSDDDSDEDEAPKSKVAPAVVKNGPVATKKKDESSESSDDSSSDEENEIKSKLSAAGVKKQPAKKDESNETSDSDSDSSSSDEDSDPKAKLNALPKKLLAAKKVESSDDTSDSSSDDDDDMQDTPSIKKLADLAGAAKKKVETSDDSSDESSQESDDNDPKTEAAAVAKPSYFPKKKVESSDSSDSDSCSDEDNDPKTKAVAVFKPSTAPRKKAESSDSSDSDSSSDEDNEGAKVSNGNKLVSAVKTAEGSSESDSSEDDDDSSEESDDEPQKKKLKLLLNAASNAEKPGTKSAKKDSSSSDDEDRSDDDSEEEIEEKPSKTPQKIVKDVEMVDAASEKRAPKTPATPKEQSGQSKTLFVGNLSFSVERADVENFFKNCGEVVNVRFATDGDGRFKGFGHVEFATAEAAQNALKWNDKELLGRSVRLDLARERGAYTPNSSNRSNSFQKGGRSQSHTVFVKGFDKALGEDEIRNSLEQHFSSCGEITRISIPKDYESGAVKGFAYLDFEDADSFNKALELRETEIGGYYLSVDEAKPRGDGQSRGGGGRSGGRDGGGQFGGRRRGGRGGRGRGGGGRGHGMPNRPNLAAGGTKTTFADDE